MTSSAARVTMTHRELLEAIVDYAHTLRWLCAYFRPAQNRRGHWQTPVGADGAGWPDLVLVRERLVVVEVKVPPDRVKPEQQMWIDQLTLAGVETHVWRPEDWPDEIARVLLRDTRRGW